MTECQLLICAGVFCIVFGIVIVMLWFGDARKGRKWGGM